MFHAQFVRTFTRGVLLLTAALSLPLTCPADQVLMKNGDRLTGTIVRMDAQKLLFKSEYAGQLTIPWEAVSDYTSSNVVYVGLNGGQVVSGAMSLSGQKAEMKTAAAGLVATDRAQIQYIRSADEQKVYEAEIDRYRNPRLVDLWTGFVDIGLSFARGNARTSSTTASAGANRVTTRDKIEVYFTSIYASNSTTGVSLVTANARRGGVNYNLNVTPKLFAFGLSDLEYDDFQGLDLRFAPAAGLGYSLWKGERGSFNLVGGASLNREFFATGLNRTSGEVLFGNETSYRLSSKTALRQKATFYPNVSDTGQYRMNFDTTAETALWKWLGWQFTVSDRLLSDPLPGRRKNDFLFSTGFRLTFAK
jgi:putative salt-induced outer membrane protein YdiY